MKIKETLMVSLSGLRTNKVRSLLTILGIVIGISSVTTAITVGQGAEKMILDQISSLGSNNIFIEPGAWSERMERGSMMQSMAEGMQIKTLKNSDEEALEGLSSVELAAPYTYGVGRVVYQGESQKITFLGTDEDAKELTDTQIISGRNLDKKDVLSMARVVVMGYQTKEDLFGSKEAVGEKIRIGRSSFRVIGVMEEQGPQAFMDIDSSILVPISTAQKVLSGEDYLRFIVVKAQGEEYIDMAIDDIRIVLRKRHNIYNPEGDTAKDDFKVMSQEDTAKIVGNVTGIFTVLLSSIAAISLVVGGVGIMNIMLVSVAERTREIGLRKSVGANSEEIRNQFLAESVILTLVGGILGLLFGVLLSFLASFAFQYFLGNSWGFFVPINAFLLSLGVSFGIGLVFGLYPAQKAAQLSPIEALRYE